MQKFEFLRQPLLGELAMSRKKREEREKEKKMPFIVATYVYASSQGQRTYSARTKINSFCSSHNYVLEAENDSGTAANPSVHWRTPVLSVPGIRWDSQN